MYSKHQRFEGIKRNYTPETVEKLRGSLKIEYTLAKRGTLKLWNYLTRGGNSYINAMGALTGKKMLLLRFPRRFDFDGGSSLTARESHSLSPKYGEYYNVARNLLGGLAECLWHALFRCPYNFFSVVYQQGPTEALIFFFDSIFTATSTQENRMTWESIATSKWTLDLDVRKRWRPMRDVTRQLSTRFPFKTTDVRKGKTAKA